MVKKYGEGPGHIPSKLPAFLKEVSQILFALTIRATKTAMLTLEGSRYKKQEHKVPTTKTLADKHTITVGPVTLKHHLMMPTSKLHHGHHGFAPPVQKHYSIIPLQSVSDEKPSPKHPRKS